jgi:hypothetical protein
MVSRRATAAPACSDWVGLHIPRDQGSTSAQPDYTRACHASAPGGLRPNGLRHPLLKMMKVTYASYRQA